MLIFIFVYVFIYYITVLKNMDLLTFLYILNVLYKNTFLKIERWLAE